jgi:hypothetical protein
MSRAHVILVVAVFSFLTAVAAVAAVLADQEPQAVTAAPYANQIATPQEPAADGLRHGRLSTKRRLPQWNRQAHRWLLDLSRAPRTRRHGHARVGYELLLSQTLSVSRSKLRGRTCGSCRLDVATWVEWARAERCCVRKPYTSRFGDRMAAGDPSSDSTGLRLLAGCPRPIRRAETSHQEIEIAIPGRAAIACVGHHSAGGRNSISEVRGHHVSIIPLVSRIKSTGVLQPSSQ